MIAISRLEKYRRDELDRLVSLNAAPVGYVIDYEKDFPPIEKLYVPLSFIENCCPVFLSGVSSKSDKRGILTEQHLSTLLAELNTTQDAEHAEIIRKEILKFADKYEKEGYYLAYEDWHA